MFKVFGVLSLMATIVAGFMGWVFNLIIVAHSDFAHITGLLVLRIIGIVIPIIGAVLGWIS